LSVAFSANNLRATERHLSYAIARCCLTPNMGERAPP